MGLATEPRAGAPPSQCAPAGASLRRRHRLPHAPRHRPRVVRSLTQQSAWVEAHQNVFLVGPTGIGKTWLAPAIAQKACRDGYSALFLKAAELFRDLAASRADGSHSKHLYHLGHVDVLIVDDWAMAPLTEAERRDFLEICDTRYQGALGAAHQPTPGCILACADRRSDDRRFHSRPLGAQRSPYRTPRRIDAPRARQQSRKGSRMSERRLEVFCGIEWGKGAQTPPPRPTPLLPAPKRGN